MTDPLPHIQVSGTHCEVGRQLGEAGRDLVARSLAYYADLFPRMVGYSFTEAVERARPYLEPAERHAPGSVEQIRGLAEGAGVDFDQLFALNCSEEFTCLPDAASGPGREGEASGDDAAKRAGAGKSAAAGKSGAAGKHEGAGTSAGAGRRAGAGESAGAAAPEHCTTFAIVTGGRTVAGHNEDWYPGDVECLIIRDVTLEGGTHYLSVGPAAYLPITAITSHGMCGGANTLYSWDMGVGVPNNMLLASLHECASLTEIRARIESLPRARGSNHLLCDAGGHILDVETTATRFAWLDGGCCYVHTNHYRLPELVEQDQTTSKGTFKRCARAEELLAAGIAAGADPVALGKTVLTDHANQPLSICSHWDDGDEDPGQSVTTVSHVWEPAEGRLHVAIGQPCEHEYLTYSL